MGHLMEQMCDIWGLETTPGVGPAAGNNKWAPCALYLRCGAAHTSLIATAKHRR